MPQAAAEDADIEEEHESIAPNITNILGNVSERIAPSPSPGTGAAGPDVGGGRQQQAAPFPDAMHRRNSKVRQPEQGTHCSNRHREGGKTFLPSFGPVTLVISACTVCSVPTAQG